MGCCSMADVISAINSQEVAKLYPGPILVLGSPGTGKTQTLALRINDLVKRKHVDPNEITVITFTNEAAINMRYRISDLERLNVYLCPEEQPRLICTMHSLGQRIIAENFSEAGLRKDFRIITSNVLKQILLGDSSQLIGFERDKSKETEMCRRKGYCVMAPEDPKCKTCSKYKELLVACNALDYDDQIMLACKLLKNKQIILDIYKKKTKYLLVDEYQDINHAQFEFIKLLVKGQEDGLFCVGDDDQSIYGFRGGSPNYIRNFEKDFNNAKVKTLGICHRCSPSIFKSALEMVKKYNPERLKKPIPTFKKIDNKVIFYDVPSQIKEAQMIAKIVKDALPSKKVLILIPHRGFAEPIKNALRRWRINCTCKTNVDDSGINLLDTLRIWREAKSDNFALRRCIQAIVDSGKFNIPPVGVRKVKRKRERDAVLKEISRCWDKVIKEGICYFDSLKESAKKYEVIRNMVEALETIQNFSKVNTGDFLKLVIDLLKPWVNIDGALIEISKFLEEVKSQDIGGSRIVRILTMQQAKGLGADLVIVVGLDKMVFPREDINQTEEQEASRLFYVSMTRAGAELYLFHARTRQAAITFLTPPRGQAYNILEKSPFINYIPSKYINKKYIQSRR